MLFWKFCVFRALILFVTSLDIQTDLAGDFVEVGETIQLSFQQSAKS